MPFVNRLGDVQTFECLCLNRQFLKKYTLNRIVTIYKFPDGQEMSIMTEESNRRPEQSKVETYTCTKCGRIYSDKLVLIGDI